MKRPRFIQSLPIILLLGFSSLEARGDGGVIRLREIQGSFVVTIFTSGDPMQDNPFDVSVMVQERDSNEAILDASVKLVFTSLFTPTPATTEQICGETGVAAAGPVSQRITFVATRGQASNKLLYAAPVKFSAAGEWQLQAFIKHDGDAVVMACPLQVGPPPRKLLALFPYLILPPLMVALFALNQWLRGQLREKTPSPWGPRRHACC